MESWVVKGDGAIRAILAKAAPFTFAVRGYGNLVFAIMADVGVALVVIFPNLGSMKFE